MLPILLLALASPQEGSTFVGQHIRDLPEFAALIETLDRADVDLDVGEYSRARVTIEAALRELEVRAPLSVEMAKAKRLLARAWSSLGNPGLAVNIGEEALLILRHAKEPENKIRGAILSDLSVHLVELHGSAPPRAFEVMEEAVALLESADPFEHDRLAIALNNLSHLYFLAGNFERTEELLIRALELFRLARGAKHIDTVTGLLNLASLRSNMGDEKGAWDTNEEALEICRAALDPFHPKTAQALDAVGISRLLGDQIEEGLAAMEEALLVRSGYLDRLLPLMSEAERISYLEKELSPTGLLYFLAATETDRADGLAYPACFALKGKASQLLHAQRTPEAEMDAKQRADLSRLREVQAQLSNLLYQAESDRDDDYAESMTSLRVERNQLELQLNQALGFNQANMRVDFSKLHAAIPKNAAILDFYSSPQDGVFCWVLRHDQDLPILVALYPGRADQLEQEFLTFMGEMGADRGAQSLQDAKGRYQTPGNDALVENLWSRIAPHLDGIETLLISPQGTTARLAFGALRLEDGRYLLEKYRIAYLEDPTSVLLPVAERAQDGRLLAIGNVDYYRRGKHDDPSATSRGSANFTSRWLPLPGTKQEVRAVLAFHEDGLESERERLFLTRREATEERVKKEISRFQYIHFATHGFFEPGDLPSLLGEDGTDTENPVAFAQRQTAQLLPGLLSGLVLAGANETPDPGRDDAYLTSDEVTYLDLSNAELVALSACETALGSERAGSGLVSLRRAFHMAGARTVLSSLWKVDDEAASTLMVDFYEALWYEGKSTTDALRDAQLAMLRRNRAREGSGRPSTWGAFLLSGDWR